MGPTADGEIPAVQACRLRNVGMWLKLNGGAVYGTRAGAIPPTASTVSTRREDVHYVHTLAHTSDCVELIGVPQTVQQACLLRDGTPLALERHNGAFRVTIPEEARDPFDTVIELR